jgi:UDP-N-acetylmuramate: L-alanyl-gamma-D-glutamyl-meso-diaminopimelate ligase
VTNVVEETNRLRGDRAAVAFEEPQAIAAHIASHASSGDIVLVMSNGAFGGVHQKILDALKNNS